MWQLGSVNSRTTNVTGSSNEKYLESIMRHTGLIRNDESV